MKHILYTLIFLSAAITSQAQITFTSDSTFVARDSQWIQLDTISVSGKTWYQISNVTCDRSGNRVVTTYQPRTRKQMLEYVREGLEQEKQTIVTRTQDLEAAKARRSVFLAIRDAIQKK